MDENTKEILYILQEECAEVSQSISKCLRFGFDQCRPGVDETNVMKLEQELGDLDAMIELLIKARIGVTRNKIAEYKKQKFEKLKLYSNIKVK